MVIEITGYLPILCRIGSENYLGAVLCFKMICNIFILWYEFVFYNIQDMRIINSILCVCHVESWTSGCKMTVFS